MFERKTRTIFELSRTMLKYANLPNVYWKEVVHSAIYILNRVQVRANYTKTPYELWYGISTMVKYFQIFERKCYIRRDEEDLGKFDIRSNEIIFLGCYTNSKEY